ncbi:hypothetical protein DCC39_18670 [Pueribacillus theae]|uniref:C4-dicarboxylate ABC transporter substrate-binding protein n=1 Tax=Pueribacillus theae TaxID=2171751 RepID=A0A2U1JIH2_9BACI|nr:TRAP transporter substrate-binding protein DctP [Pueribacillus theae]PWA04688.1 hypothetical protein DCC39_18670 [Pueribacillus theae]
MFTKRKGLFGLFVLLMGILLVGCGSKSDSKSESANGGDKGSSDEVYEINVNNWQPSTHHYAYNVYEPWKELVEEKTDGRVKVNLYHGGSLGKSSSVYQDITGGLYEVSILVPQYFYDTNFFPYSIGNLPFMFKDSNEAAAVLKKFGEKYADDDLTDIILTDPTATDPYALFSTQPIKTVDDLKKKKMRSSGKSETALAKSIGGVPVSLTTEDQYEGLQKKQIDTTFFTPIGANGQKLYEPAPYITKLGVSVTPLIPVMNKDFHDSLPDDLKKLFDEELFPKLSELIIESYDSELDAAYADIEKAVEKRGEVITPTDEELEEFREAGKPAWDEWVEDANKKGYNGQEMLDDLLKMIDEERK